jgi:hypothetical protein
MTLADLHLHSTASDGSLSPAALVAGAKKAGLEVIALTDHDTVAGLPEAKTAGKSHSIRVLPGLELSAELREEVHILGYLFDCRQEGLLSLLAGIREGRQERIKRIFRRLGDLGFALDWKEVTAMARPGGSLGRPHLARLMVAKGYAASISEVFARWIGPGGPAFVPREKLHPAQAIKAIQDAGGLAFVAHPGLLQGKDTLARVLALGADGLEIYHPKHSPEQVQFFRRTAEEKGLLLSGGSDFHGFPGEILGAGAVKGNNLAWLNGTGEKGPI